MQAPRSPRAGRLAEIASGSKLLRVLSYADFRLLWIGAFISFTGSWVQNVAQGYFVFRLTESEAKLALVTFCTSVPVFFFGLVAGSISDRFDKRRVLVVSQVLLSCASLFMSAAIYFQFIQYWMIVLVALFIGIVLCVEMPTRQSIVSRVVPPEDLAAAVPVNAMTFNIARIFGPAIGGVVLAQLGVPLCYLINGITFLGLIWAATAIKADLRPLHHEPQPIRDLVMEGALYTFKDSRLKTLFLLESITAAFGIAFVPLLPAFVEQVMGYGVTAGDPRSIGAAKQALGYAYTAIGVGALSGLLTVTHLAHSERKGDIIRVAMWIIGIGLLILSVARSPWVAYPVLALLGAATVAQFNTTNALFQLLSPDRLRGRVLAMHIWALNGLSPFGVLIFGWLATQTRLKGDLLVGNWVVHMPSRGVPLVLQVAGICMTLGAIGALIARAGLSNLRYESPSVAAQ